MEVFQIERIIKNLVHIRFDNMSFANFEFKAEHDPLIEKNNIDTLTQTRNIILKNDASVFIIKP